MKKFLLLFVAVFFSTFLYSQVRSLGTAANAYTASGIRHFLWADPTIGNGTVNGTILFIHRTTGDTSIAHNYGRLVYDVSMDNGTTFDTSIGPVYSPSLSPVINPSGARYPQGAIFNPTGSNLAVDAFLTYDAPTLNNTNPSSLFNGYSMWGGNAYGVYKLDGSLSPTQHELVSDSLAGIWYMIPEIMHMCKNGNTFVLSESDYGNSSLYGSTIIDYDYTGTMILQKGTWNSSTSDYDYTHQLLPVPAGTLPYDYWYRPQYSMITGPVSTMINSSLVFNDNGQVGFMVYKEFLNTADSPDSSATLYVFKTTDGGLTWNPISFQYFDWIDHLCADSGFGMGFVGMEFDLAMDANNNLHIITCVGTKYMDSHWGTSVTSDGIYGGLFDIFTINGGSSWRAHKLNTNPFSSMLGVMGDPATSSNRLVYDLRPQIARSYDGTKLLFCWFETDTNALTQGWPPDWNNMGYNNQHPDMHLVGHDITSDMWTVEMNATKFPALNGDADGVCLLGSVSYYALDNGSGGYKIPTVIGIPTANTTNNNADQNLPFQFSYLDGIEVSSSAYTNPPIEWPMAGANDIFFIMPRTSDMNNGNGFIVTPVRPNPATDHAELQVQIAMPGDITVEVTNAMGQVISSEEYPNQSAGLHRFPVNTRSASGLFLCTVIYNGQRVTQKFSTQ